MSKSLLSDTLEGRMKGYEKASAYQFPSRNTIVVRVDGVAFHTFTKGANKPFDLNIGAAMLYATEKIHSSVQGCVLGYTQSDEASFLLTDLTGPKTEGWFGFKKSKMESVIASMFTYHFNDFLSLDAPHLQLNPNGDTCPALFDARAFSVPSEDAPNVFVWRQRDAYKNFINLVARTEFGHSAIQGKRVGEMVEMLTEKLGEHPTNSYDRHFSYGTTYSNFQWSVQESMGYHGFRQLIEQE